jgi:hypothetical protein
LPLYLPLWSRLSVVPEEDRNGIKWLVENLVSSPYSDDIFVIFSDMLPTPGQIFRPSSKHFRWWEIMRQFILNHNLSSFSGQRCATSSLQSPKAKLAHHKLHEIPSPFGTCLVKTPNYPSSLYAYAVSDLFTNFNSNSLYNALLFFG